MTLKRLFGKFTKVEKQEDGTLYVEGIASSEAVDSDGEIVKAAAMSAALPDYMKFGALREMHQAIAAGKVLAATVDESGVTHIAAKVVDPVAVKKVEEGVYQGFSIGGRVTKRGGTDTKTIEALKLVEISLVDRPSNPDALLELFKADVQAEPEAGKTSPATDPAAAAPTTATKSETPKPAPAAVPPAKTEPPKPGKTTIAKDMRHVAWAAELCDSIASLAKDAQFEADYEGDGSPIPGRIRGVCREMGDILTDLASEEAGELVQEDDDMSAAEKPGALKKTEKFATIVKAFMAAVKGEDTAGRIAAAEEATAAAGDALRKVVRESDGVRRDLANALLTVKAKGVSKDPKFIETAAKAEELSKALVAAEDATEKAGKALTKILAERDDLQKQRDALEKANTDAGKKFEAAIAEIVDQRDELLKHRDDLVTRLAKAEVKLAVKGVLKVIPIDKAKDVPEPFVKDEQLPAEGTPERALHELRKIHARGGRPLALGAPMPSTEEQRK